MMKIAADVLDADVKARLAFWRLELGALAM